MSPAKASLFATFGILAGPTLGPTFAQDAMVDLPDVANMSVEQIIELRVLTMRSNGRTLRGANTLSGAEAVAAGEQIRRNAITLKVLFPEGSNTGDSNAMDLIWQDWDDFVPILDSLEADANAMIEAAEAGDPDTYVAAVRQVGRNCGTCHDTYRAEMRN